MLNLATLACCVGRMAVDRHLLVFCTLAHLQSACIAKSITSTLSSVSTSQSGRRALTETNLMGPTYGPTLTQAYTLKNRHFPATSRLLGRMSSTKIRCCVLC